jgi:dihydroorotase-like cyclic amidohydrolase
MARYDTVILNGQVVLPGRGPTWCQIGIKDGRIAAIAQDLVAQDGDEVVDARGLMVFPGAVDSHFHIGIYRPLEADARSETASSLVGGATTVLSYFRTGHHYLNRTGAYRDILPEVVQATASNAYTDFAFHLAPMTREHLGEIDWLVGQGGVASFKYYMFYKGLNLAADSTDAAGYTMSETYDLGHLYTMMEEVTQANQRYGGPGRRVSLSIHCENPELIKLFIERVKQSGLPPLEAYSRARPPLTERLSIHEAAVLANEAKTPVNLLHLSSREALAAAVEVERLYPTLDVRRETTLHHLCLTYSMLEGKGLGGKVNPPIREAGDVEELWRGVEDGRITWVASDHACCLEEEKGDDLWPALPGFGGTALLYPVMISEGFHRRGLPLERVADLVSTNPARAFSCYPQKGAVTIGADADLAFIDLHQEEVVTPDLLHSAQDHTPFEGVRVKGWPVRTMLRGQTVFLNGTVIGAPGGQFITRPTGE